MQIFVYDGHAKPARVSEDEDLPKILGTAKAASKTKLTTTLETTSKSFAAWTLKDVRKGTVKVRVKMDNEKE